MITRESLGQAIALARGALTQEELAVKADVPLPTLRSWEQGRAVPGVIAFNRVVEAIGITAHDLIHLADSLERDLAS